MIAHIYKRGLQKQQSLPQAACQALCIYPLVPAMESNSSGLPHVLCCFSPALYVANCSVWLSSVSGTWAPEQQQSHSLSICSPLFPQGLSAYEPTRSSVFLVETEKNINYRIFIKLIYNKLNERYKINLPLITPMISG